MLAQKYLKNYKKLTAVTLCILVVSVLGKISFSNVLASGNYTLSDLYLEKQDLEKEISKLSYIDAGLSTMPRIETEAQKLGFVPMDFSLLSLDSAAPVPIASISTQ